MQKVGRNDPCPCGSGKKFKKCCEEKVAKKKFNATLLTPPGEVTDKAQKISTNFFQRVVTPQTPPPPEAPSQENKEDNINS